MMRCNSYYGGYRTRTFAEIFSEDDQGASFEYFTQVLNETPFKDKLEEVDLELAFYLLYARYGNSHIAYSDENQFVFALFSTMFQYGPSWAKELDIQTKLRKITDNELVIGSRAVYNHSFNPSTTPSTDVLEPLPTINDQNTTNYVRSKMEAYGELMMLLKTDVSEVFIGRFKKLFITITAPDYPLLYETTITEVE